MGLAAAGSKRTLLVQFDSGFRPSQNSSHAHFWERRANGVHSFIPYSQSDAIERGVAYDSCLGNFRPASGHRFVSEFRSPAAMQRIF
jgi:hypothetical protein